MKKQQIWLGNDHGGYEVKQELMKHLQDKGFHVVNVGSDSKEIVRYPYYAAKVAGAVSKGEVHRGILICSTGIGMSVIANKFKSVRAALCTTSYMAKMTRLHNDSNILCLGGKITGIFEILEIVDVWLSTGYMGERHQISLDLIKRAEETMLCGELWEPFEAFSTQKCIINRL